MRRVLTCWEGSKTVESIGDVELPLEGLVLFEKV